MTRSSKHTPTESHECEHDVAVALRAHGLRPTRARCQLLLHLRSTDRHPSAEEITASLRDEGSDVGVATVYQNLNRLVEAGLLRRFKGADGRSRFDADVSAHSHAVCDSCGRMADIEIGEDVARTLDLTSSGDERAPGWLLTHAAVELRGVCPGCRSN